MMETIKDLIREHINDSQTRKDADGKASDIKDFIDFVIDEFKSEYCEETGNLLNECYCARCVQDRKDINADYIIHSF